MSNFFRKIPQSLVVLVLVCAVFTGHVFADEGDSTSAPSADVTPSVSSDSAPEVPSPSPAPDTPDSSSDDADSSSWDDDSDSSYYPSYGGYDTFTVSGADVTVNVEKHDTLSVTSVASGVVDGLDRFSRSHDDSETPTLAETIRTLFGSYTPRTQTVTTYYDGQPISTDEQIVPGLAGLDFEWLAGVAMFALITFCLLGGVLKNG